MTDTDFYIDKTWVDNRQAIESRVAELADEQRDLAAQVLSYLYLTDGPRSIPRDQKFQAEQCLSPVERFVFQWLHKRTDGKLRRIYGPGVLEAVKRSGYQCKKCGFADVRALHLEKQEQDDEPSFVCLCANCHTVESRAREMAKIVVEKVDAAELTAATNEPADESSVQP